MGVEVVVVDLDSIIVSESSSLVRHQREVQPGIAAAAAPTTSTTTIAAVATTSTAIVGQSNQSHLLSDPASSSSSSLALALAAVEQLQSAVKVRRMPLVGLSTTLSQDNQASRKLIDVGLREVLPLPLHKHAREVLLKYGRLYRHLNNDAPSHHSGEKGGIGMGMGIGLGIAIGVGDRGEKPPSPKNAELPLSPKNAGDKGTPRTTWTPRAGLGMMQPSPLQQQHKSQSTSPYLNNHPHVGGGGGPDNSINTIHVNNNNVNNNNR